MPLSINKFAYIFNTYKVNIFTYVSLFIDSISVNSCKLEGQTRCKRNVSEFT